MAASKRSKIMLKSTGVMENGQPSDTCYFTTVGPNVTEKLSINKFDPKAFDKESGKKGCYVVFKQKKIPK